MFTAIVLIISFIDCDKQHFRLNFVFSVLLYSSNCVKNLFLDVVRLFLNQNLFSVVFLLLGASYGVYGPWCHFVSKFGKTTFPVKIKAVIFATEGMGALNGKTLHEKYICSFVKTTIKSAKKTCSQNNQKSVITLFRISCL